ncbi:hypothetical protein TEA_007847 [Camellia sinensis var. sinensis]|uniref:Uncharacterized protein n=1 Tax=Camellia sinensis var. sinensis TaxID=542762 RepID=A0A4S4ECN3_CAMSN|nr:hypothetical protein TEA_007847 [Camellia sinensis var. sinensis]
MVKKIKIKARKKKEMSDFECEPREAKKKKTTKQVIEVISNEMICVDNLPLSQPKPVERVLFPDKAAIYKLCDENDKCLLNKIYNLETTDAIIWSGTGNRVYVTLHDVDAILRDGDTANNVIDNFVEMLQIEQEAKKPEKNKSFFFSSFCWASLSLSLLRICDAHGDGDGIGVSVGRSSSLPHGVTPPSLLSASLSLSAAMLTAMASAAPPLSLTASLLAHGVYQENEDTNQSVVDKCVRFVVDEFLSVYTKPRGQGSKGLAWHHANCFIELSPTNLLGWESLPAFDQATALALVKKVLSSTKGGTKVELQADIESSNGGAKHKRAVTGDQKSKIAKSNAGAMLSKTS